MVGGDGADMYDAASHVEYAADGQGQGERESKWYVKFEKERENILKT